MQAQVANCRPSVTPPQAKAYTPLLTNSNVNGTNNNYQQVNDCCQCLIPGGESEGYSPRKDPFPPPPSRTFNSNQSAKVEIILPEYYCPLPPRGRKSVSHPDCCT